MNVKKIAGYLVLLLCAAGCGTEKGPDGPESLSGIYPRLGYYNNEGECGTGAVVPWAGRLWVITYGPHLPQGSSDKLYEITPGLQQIVRRESIGGTPANRMIHRESGQLFIGPYAIDSQRRVRTIPYTAMPGRHTGNARHLTDPAHKIYYATMEEGFYEVDVNFLEVKELYRDGNAGAHIRQPGSYIPSGALLPGVHGKGAYSGQGVLVFTNNGEGTSEALVNPGIEAGVLAEWDGKDWTIVRRCQFTEITGPGGLSGNRHPATDPLWTVGWDARSLLVGVRDAVKGWSFYRLPKASHSYDGAHGWNTEWPRIRNIGTDTVPEYLMTMHGMFWHFPAGFSAAATSGIRPRSAYLKVIGDFARWNGRLVFGCDDAAQKEFLNRRKAKGRIGGPGQSNSNLWFTSLTKPDELGPSTADGAVWLNEPVRAGSYSEPFLFAGWDYRSCWLENAGDEPVTFTFETDETGAGDWTEFKIVRTAAREARRIAFLSTEKGEWIRVKADRPTVATVSFSYVAREKRKTKCSPLFDGIAPVAGNRSVGGLLYGLGNNRRTLGVLSQTVCDGAVTDNGYYELTDSLRLVRKEDRETELFISQRFAVSEPAVAVEKSSVLVVDDRNRRWRLPLGHAAFRSPDKQRLFRLCREVVTERDLFNCQGTFYELPAENAGGYARIRPVASHAFGIHDYASYRGLLVMTGIDPEKVGSNEHIIVSNDRKASVWAGCIDDLWELGKPVGQGGPWLDTPVSALAASDPYLIAFYDRKVLRLSHTGNRPVCFTAEIDPTGSGRFVEYRRFRVEPGKTLSYRFPDGFQGRWIRFRTDTDVCATAWLEYK